MTARVAEPVVVHGATRWTRGHLAVLVAGLLAAIAARLVLLPTPGFTGEAPRRAPAASVRPAARTMAA